MDNINKISQYLTEKFGSIQDASWFRSLQKDAFSKNITAADWNSLVYKAAVTSNDTEVLKKALTEAIDCLEPCIQDVADLKNRATSLENRSTSLEGRATDLEAKANSLEASDGALDSKIIGVAQALNRRVNTLVANAADGTLADDMAVDPYDGKSTLQTVLTALTSYVTKLEDDISGGQLARDIYVGEANINGTAVKYLASYLSQLKTYVNTLEANLNNGVILNRIIAKNHGTIYEKSLSEVIADLETAANKAYRYMGSTPFEYLESNASNRREGDVWNISNSFELKDDDKTYSYPAGTNVAWNATGKKWDPLGGYIDYGSLAQEISVTPYSGKTLLQDVLDILSTPWDLIITDPAKLGMLSTASGNVLVNLEDLYETSEVTITVSANVRLIDFANSIVSGIDAINAAVKNVVIRHLNARSRCTLKNFAVVEHCNGAIVVDSCTEVRNCIVTFANACTNIHDCTCGLPKTYTEKVMFDSCSLISNLTVLSLEAIPDSDRGTVEFSNCHHISNIHCRDNDGHDDGTLAQRIHYENCTYVDPYTCAGYVQTENIGKVPVPDSSGGVQFKEFMPKQSNSTSFFRLIGVGSDGNYYQKSASARSTEKDFVPIRTRTGQLVAPNQETSAPTDDEYVSKRYLDIQAANAQKHIENNYLKLKNNTSNVAFLYGQAANGGGAATFNIVSGAAAQAVPYRDAYGQIAAPNQVTYKPDLDQYISRRYLEANAPSGGGGKLYRHSIHIMSYEGGFWCCEVYFTLYTTHSTAYNDVYELPLQEGETIPAGGNYDPHDMSESVYPVTSFIYNNLTPRLEYFYSPNEYDQKTKCGRDIFTIERGENVCTIFTDTVTEV